MALDFPLLCKEGLGEVEARKWAMRFHSGVRGHFCVTGYEILAW